MASSEIEEKKRELGRTLNSLVDLRFTVNRVFEVIRGEESPHLVVPSKLRDIELQNRIKSLARDAGFVKIVDKNFALNSKDSEKEIKEIEKLVKKYSK